MYSMTHEHNEHAYGLKHYVVDTEADVATLPSNASTIIPGSTAFVIGTSTTYMLNNQREWVKITVGGSNSGSSDGSDTPSADNTYIWDGGSIG